MRVLHNVSFIALLASGCSDPTDGSLSGQELYPGNPSGARWYSSEQVASGSQIFETNCSECHGANAEGRYANWKQKLPDGSFPPPPLDGSAHAWHHPRSVLLEVIENGGLALGGKMPAFGAVLNGEEKLAAIAYFQNFWDDETYNQWEVMGGTR